MKETHEDHRGCMEDVQYPAHRAFTRAYEILVWLDQEQVVDSMVSLGSDGSGWFQVVLPERFRPEHRGEPFDPGQLNQEGITFVTRLIERIGSERTAFSTVEREDSPEGKGECFGALRIAFCGALRR